LRFDIYTDSSHTHHHGGIAACAYFIIKNLEPYCNEVVVLQGFRNSNQGELHAVRMSLERLLADKDAPTSVYVFTDHRNITDRPKMKYKNEILGNILRELEQKGVSVEFVYVKGHSGNKLNNTVDQNARKYLREYVKKMA